MTTVIIISITLLLSIIIPLTCGNLTTTTTTPPLIPSIQSPSSAGKLTSSSCHLDLSSELFGGVSSACSSSTPLDRGRCCPVLAAWLFAAHSRSSLSSPSDEDDDDGDDGLLPLMPEDDSQRCVDSLHSSLRARNIELPRVNDTCDTVLCFCGIRLHQIGRLSCPKAFNVSHVRSSNTLTVKPMKVVEDLERDCRNSSYNGCTRCLRSLEKLKGGKPSSKGSNTTTDRAAKMFSRDCQLMGLTWLLAKNKTLYIPTVSAVLRALLYSTQQQPYYYTCSRDQDNMPLAVDSLQFYKLDSSSSFSFALCFPLYSLLMAAVFLFWL